MHVEGLKRFAGPAAVVVMVWIVLGFLIQLGQFLIVDGQGAYGNAGWSPFGAWEAGVLSLVVSTAVLWARPAGSGMLALAAVAVAGVGVMLQIGALVVALSAFLPRTTEPGFALLETSRLVVNLVLPVLALVWLIKLRGVASGVPETSRPALPQAQSTAPAPAWRPEQAAGAHWQTASGAATGSAANAWGTPGQRSGWGPPAPPPAAGPAHQPRGPEQFGPQALADQYGRPVGDDAEHTRVDPGHKRTPPSWTPLDGS